MLKFLKIENKKPFRWPGQFLKEWWTRNKYVDIEVWPKIRMILLIDMIIIFELLRMILHAEINSYNYV